MINYKHNGHLVEVRDLIDAITVGWNKNDMYRYVLELFYNQGIPVFIKSRHDFPRRVFMVHAPQILSLQGSSVAKPGDGSEPVESESGRKR